MLELVTIRPEYKSENEHGFIVGSEVNVNGVNWTGVVWCGEHREDDPVFFKSAGLLKLVTTNLDADNRREPKTNRFCAKCQKDIHADHKARIVRVFMQDIVVHPSNDLDFPSHDKLLIGMDCARAIGIEWTSPEV